jgi:hypothetical protein
VAVMWFPFADAAIAAHYLAKLGPQAFAQRSGPAARVR